MTIIQPRAHDLLHYLHACGDAPTLFAFFDLLILVYIFSSNVLCCVQPFDMFCFNWFFGSPVRYPIATVEPLIKDTLKKTFLNSMYGEGW